MRNRLDLIHTNDTLGAKSAIAKGNEICAELGPLYHQNSPHRKKMESILKKVQNNPSCAEEEAENLYAKAQQEGIVAPSSRQILNLW